MKQRYEFVGFDAAINLLRPGAKWEINHGNFIWNDPRPIPTKEQIEDTIRKIRDFEESIDYITLDEYDQYDECQEPEQVTKGLNSYDSAASQDGGGRGGKGGVPPQ